MNISSITNSPAYINNITNNKQIQKVDSMSSATKTQGSAKIQSPQPDAMTSATTKSGGDHSFEAKA